MDGSAGPTRKEMKTTERRSRKCVTHARPLHWVARADAGNAAMLLADGANPTGAARSGAAPLVVALGARAPATGALLPVAAVVDAWHRRRGARHPG